MREYPWLPELRCVPVWSIRMLDEGQVRNCQQRHHSRLLCPVHEKLRDLLQDSIAFRGSGCCGYSSLSGHVHVADCAMSFQGAVRLGEGWRCFWSQMCYQPRALCRGQAAPCVQALRCPSPARWEKVAWPCPASARASPQRESDVCSVEFIVFAQLSLLRSSECPRPHLDPCELRFRMLKVATSLRKKR